MSEDDKPGTLYATQNQERFFWIPDGTECAPGDVLIRTLTGGKKEISEADATRWQIAEDRAKELAQAQIRTYAKAASSMISSAGQALRQAAASAADKPAQPKTGDGPEENFADALGVTTDQLKNDPAAVLEGLKGVMQGIGETIKQSASDHPADQEVVKARMELLAAVVREKTGDESISANVEALPSLISNFLADPELVGRIRKATEDLKRASAEIRATSAVKKQDG